MQSHKPPFLSILVTCYNQESYIYDCLSSILNFAPSIPYEIIIVNDGSTDKSESIIKEFLNQLPKTISITYVSNENHGVSQTRNLCLNLAKGDYHIFIDGDDCWFHSLDVFSEDLLEKKYDLITFHAKFINEKNKEIKLSEYFKRSSQIKSGEYNGIDFFRMAMNKNQFNCVPYLFFLKKNNLRFIPSIVFEDELYTSELVINSLLLKATNKQIYSRRIVSNSITHQSPKDLHFFSFMIVIEKLLQRFSAYPHEKCYQQHTNNLISSFAHNQMKSSAKQKKYYKDLLKLIIRYKFIYKIRPLNLLKLMLGRLIRSKVTTPN